MASARKGQSHERHSILAILAHRARGDGDCGGAATAAPGLATTDVNMRQGPGMNFPVVMTIPGGSNIDVRSCDAG